MTDRIKKGEVKVIYFPTANMLAVFFTKPLQGSAFQRMRHYILNLPSTSKTSEVHRSVLEKAKINGLNLKDKPMTRNKWMKTNLENKEYRGKLKKKGENIHEKIGLAHNLNFISVR